MNYNELLLDFVDGNLPFEQEESLFLQLSSSDELRMKLKQILAIDTSIKNNSNYFIPPAEATIGVFSQLGFHAPNTAVGNSIVSALNTAKNFGLAKYSYSLVSGLLSAIITSLFFLLFIIPGHNYNLPNANNNLQSTVGSQLNTPETKYIPNITSRETKRNFASKRNVESDKTKFSNKPINKMVEEFKTEEALIELSLKNIITNTDIPESMANNFIRLNNNTESDYPADFNIQKQPIFFQEFSDKNVSLELSNSQNWSLPKETIMPSEFAKFNNTNLGLYYHFNDDLSIGLNIRQENFFMKFEGTEQSGKEAIYEEQPNFTTYSIGLRYKIAEISDINIYGQFESGLNKAGLVNRLYFGGKYSPYRDIGFILGLEFDLLSYLHQNKLFNSKKIGFVYGVTFNL
jgi:hypothetical protein